MGAAVGGYSRRRRLGRIRPLGPGQTWSARWLILGARGEGRFHPSFELWSAVGGVPTLDRADEMEKMLNHLFRVHPSGDQLVFAHNGVDLAREVRKALRSCCSKRDATIHPNESHSRGREGSGISRGRPESSRPLRRLDNPPKVRGLHACVSVEEWNWTMCHLEWGSSWMAPRRDCRSRTLSRRRGTVLRDTVCACGGGRTSRPAIVWRVRRRPSSCRCVVRVCERFHASEATCDTTARRPAPAPSASVVSRSFRCPGEWSCLPTGECRGPVPHTPRVL